MATQASPHPAAQAASVLLSQNTPQLNPGSSAAPDRGAGTELVAGPGVRLGATPPESDFRNSAESADRQQNGDSPGLRLSAPLERMPVSLGVSIPVRGFRVRSLLAMRPGELVETQWVNGEDLPLSSGELQLAWCEFEVVDTRLAVRLTRLA